MDGGFAMTIQDIFPIFAGGIGSISLIFLNSLLSTNKELAQKIEAYTKDLGQKIETQNRELAEFKIYCSLHYLSTERGEKLEDRLLDCKSTKKK